MILVIVYYIIRGVDLCDYNEWEQPFYAMHKPKNKISLNKTNPIIKSFYRDRLIDKVIK